jgi:hypothetical protein
VSRLVIIAPLKADARERALQLLAEGPPFQLEQTRFDRHHVYLTHREAIFVFEGPGPATLELPGEDPALLRVAEAWNECLAEKPRVARAVFSWERVDGPEGVSFAPTPGPGDSEGGDLYSPSDKVLAGGLGAESADGGDRE